MKHLLLSIFIIIAGKLFGQIQPQRPDSIYYLVDTAHTPGNDRMWNISSDGTQFKTYTILCPCLLYNGNPKFFYSLWGKDNSMYKNKKELRAIKLINLSSLIIRSKQIENDSFNRDHHIFLIEPAGKKYVIHEVMLMNPAITIVSPPDVVEGKADTTALSGAPQVSSKDIRKYTGQTVITSGKIVGARDKNDSVGLLMVGIDSLHQYFTIFLNGNGTHNFYPAGYYKRYWRWIKVKGKVTEYLGKPAIEIGDEEQMREIPPEQR